MSCNILQYHVANLIRHLPDPTFKLPFLHYFWNLTSLCKTELSLNEWQIKNLEWRISSFAHSNTALQRSELLLEIMLGWRKQCLFGVPYQMAWLHRICHWGAATSILLSSCLPGANPDQQTTQNIRELSILTI
jgi:hypothetical protein